MRPYDLPEYDREFVDEHIRQSSRSGNDEEFGDGSHPDGDATFSGLCHRIFDWLCPPAHRTDFTVRADATPLLARHAGSIALLLRESFAMGLVQFVVLAIVLSKPQLSRRLVFSFVAAALCAVAIKVVIRREFRIVFLYISILTGPWLIFLWITDNTTEPLYAQLWPYLAGWLLWPLLVGGVALMLGGGVLPWLRWAIVALSCLYLAEQLGCPHTHTKSAWILSVTLFLAANALGTSIIASGFQRWMLAGHGVVLETIRRNGSPRVGDRRAKSTRLGTSVLLLGACATAVAWTVAAVGFLADFRRAAGAPSEELQALARLGASLAICHTGNWLFAEIAYQRRFPRPDTWLRSFYVAWRGLTAWIAYLPALEAPQVFQFPRPWSNASFRHFLLCPLLLINSAFTQSVAWSWLAVPPMETSVTVEQQAHPAMLTKAAEEEAKWRSYVQPPRLRISLFSFNTLVLAMSYLSIAPFLVLLFSIAAIWGPLLTAAHDAHEGIDRSAAAPGNIWFLS
jgi:hypothetical protein